VLLHVFWYVQTIQVTTPSSTQLPSQGSMTYGHFEIALSGP